MNNILNYNKWSNNLNENIFKNDFKGVKCNFCGQIVDDKYSSKISHIYNKHFNKPSMDGYVPVKTHIGNNIPQGGIKTYQLIKLYFDK